MKRSFFTFFFFVLIVCVFDAPAQQKRRIISKPKNPNAVRVSNAAVVVDERLAVLRAEPGFDGRVIQRMRRGRNLVVSAAREADGAVFYRVNSAPNYGWIQAEAVTGKFRRGDDARLAKLIQSSEGFEQIERARIFLEIFNDSPLRPAMLLLTGDLLEETALKLSTEAARRLDRREMSASGAPVHSFYLNYVSLDRYRRLNINFVFNPNTKLIHYDGANWREIVKNHPRSAEFVEAQTRLASLKEKMEKKP